MADDEVITIELPGELVEVIGGMGYDTKSYFNLIVNDLHARLQTKLEKDLITQAAPAITEITNGVKDKTKLSKHKK